MTQPIIQIVETTLIDVDPIHFAELPIRVIVTPLGVSLIAEGYGDHGSAEGHGSPIFVELRNGDLRLVVWANINEEDPTNILNLTGAREDRRRAIGE